MTQRASGFTLIEMMVVVAIVAILGAIAIPSYTKYVQRGDLVEATQALSQYRVQMEQYYQDNNTYANGAICGVAIPTPCTLNTGQAYTATATGKTGGQVAGFIYTIDQTNTQKTTWAWGLSSTTSWIVR